MSDRTWSSATFAEAMKTKTSSSSAKIALRAGLHPKMKHRATGNPSKGASGRRTRIAWDCGAYPERSGTAVIVPELLGI